VISRVESSHNAPRQEGPKERIILIVSNLVMGLVIIPPTPGLGFLLLPPPPPPPPVRRQMGVEDELVLVVQQRYPKHFFALAEFFVS